MSEAETDLLRVGWMGTSDPTELLGIHVEVYDASTGSHLMGRGRVVAYTDRPTITVEDENGVQTHHVIDLPRVEYRPVVVGRVDSSVIRRD